MRFRGMVKAIRSKIALILNSNFNFDTNFGLEFVSLFIKNFLELIDFELIFANFDKLKFL